MPFPPNFDSTKNYTNILDLDKKKIYREEKPTVFGQSTCFSVKSLPSILTYGKHHFTLSFKNSPGQRYYLKPNSKVLFEFKDEQGTVIFSDTTTLANADGVVVCYVWIKEDPLRTFENIVNGIGTFTIVGQVTDVPREWKDTYNYRVQWPIEVRKELPNTSPIIFQSASLMQTKLVLSESLDYDSGSTKYKRSYLHISASNMKTFGGKVEFVEVTYDEQKSKELYSSPLTVYPISSSVFEPDVVNTNNNSSSAKGLNAISDEHSVLVPRETRRNGTIDFRLRFLNSELEPAKDITTGEFVDLSGSLAITGSPMILEAGGTEFVSYVSGSQSLITIDADRTYTTPGWSDPIEGSIASETKRLPLIELRSGSLELYKSRFICDLTSAEGLDGGPLQFITKNTTFKMTDSISVARGHIEIVGEGSGSAKPVVYIEDGDGASGIGTKNPKEAVLQLISRNSSSVDQNQVELDVQAKWANEDQGGDLYMIRAQTSTAHKGGGDLIGVKVKTATSGDFSGDKWSGYFEDGNFYIEDNLGIGNKVPPHELTVEGDISASDTYYGHIMSDHPCGANIGSATDRFLGFGPTQASFDEDDDTNLQDNRLLMPFGGYIHSLKARSKTVSGNTTIKFMKLADGTDADTLDTAGSTIGQAQTINMSSAHTMYSFTGSKSVSTFNAGDMLAVSASWSSVPNEFDASLILMFKVEE